MRSRRLSAAALAGCAYVGGLLSLARPVFATNGSIDIFGDRNGTSCQKTLGVIDSIYVMARLTGATSDGIIQATFRIDGFPSNCILIGINYDNPSTVYVLGNPFTGDGAVVGLHCVRGDASGLVPLCSIGILVPPSATVRDVRLRVTSYPFSLTTTTPLLFACQAPDPPGYAAFPAFGGEFIINPVSSSCAISLAPASWSFVKTLYRRL
jgi:hypothetical protein